MSQPYIDLILLCYGKFATTTRPCLDSLVADCADSNFRLTLVIFYWEQREHGNKKRKGTFARIYIAFSNSFFYYSVTDKDG